MSQGKDAASAVGDKKGSRKEHILHSLASMLEATPGGRITTAALAREVGVSEAALYRHFPSKTRMFEDLIDSVDDTLFARIDQQIRTNDTANARCFHLCESVLTFCEQRPGVTRILTGDAITGENERLHLQVQSFFDKLQARMEAILADAPEGGNGLPTEVSVHLLMTMLEGRMMRFVRSGFKQLPTQWWEEEWRLVAAHLVAP